ncbi:MAG: hypothetical protein ABI718_07760 [Acidobacteriota bacterium]
MKTFRIAATGLLLTTLASPLLASPPPREVLPFVEDNYSAALQQARARNLPLFVDAWAPW